MKGLDMYEKQYPAGITVGGQSTATLLTIVFVILKLTGYINWSWWWVLSPIWISVIVFSVLVILLGILCSHTKHRGYRL